MRITQNIAALNTWRQLSLTNSSLNKSLERLSSGLRINRAADDAAGLAISEKMQAQIRGLNQAARNAQNGISLIQTAEGAIGEIHNILQRMRELAVQSASDDMTDADRAQIQKEVDQLARQITDIANTTQFNTKRILTGQYATGNTDIIIHTGANKDENLSFNISAVDAFSLGVGRIVGGLANQAIASSVDAVGSAIDSAAQYRLSYTATNNQLTLEKSTDGGASWSSVGSPKIAGTDFSWGNVLTVGDSTTGETVTITTISTAPSADQTTDLTMSKYESASSNNGWQASTGGGVLVTTQSAANAAVDIINQAINTVSGYRADLGALQNRLEHTITNLQSTAENLQAAESRIRDVDMAQEMMNFVRQQILMQSGTAMLAQANALPQTVLQLLRQ